MNTVALEQLAERVRFDSVVSATEEYISTGGLPTKLDVPVLQSAGLFPTQWKFDSRPGAYRDVWSGPIDGKIGIGIAGSASGLRPIIDSYRLGRRPDLLSISAPMGAERRFDLPSRSVRA